MSLCSCGEYLPVAASQGQEGMLCLEAQMPRSYICICALYSQFAVPTQILWTSLKYRLKPAIIAQTSTHPSWYSPLRLPAIKLCIFLLQLFKRSEKDGTGQKERPSVTFLKSYAPRNKI